jgi:dTDP-glucose 4,6-dehydratase
MKVLVTGGAGFIGTNFVLRTRATRPDLRGFEGEPGSGG